MHVTAVTIIAPATPNIPSVFTMFLILLAILVVSVIFIFLSDKLTGKLLPHTFLWLGGSGLICIVLLIVGHMVVDAHTSNVWYKEVTKMMNLGNIQEPLTEANLLETVHKQQITTLTAKTETLGNINIQVDGRALTIITSEEILLKNVETLCALTNLTTQTAQACATLNKTTP